MHIVVVGCGRVGSGLATSLEQDGHQVAIVDRNAGAFRRLGDFAGQRVIGQGFDRDTLEEAGIRRAGAFAAVTSGDNSNILAARIAKEAFQIPSVVARIYDPRRAEIYQRLGIATVATVSWATGQVRRKLLGDAAESWTDQSGSLQLVELPVPRGWAGRCLPEEVRTAVVAVSRAGTARRIGADYVAQEGDLAHAMASTAELPALREAFGLPAAGGR